MTSPAPPLLVLASGSPRRRELLGRLHLPFEVRPAEVDETPQDGEAPEQLVRRLASAKAEAGLASAPESDVVVLAADTVVVLDGEILGKPTDDADATRMLALLSGRTHRVLTGVAVARRVAPPDGGNGGDEVALAPAVRAEVEVEVTEVTFGALSDTEIAVYVATGEPADKAGAYGIQGRGGRFVSSIRGNHDNVVGLGLATTSRLLTRVGLHPAR